MSEWLLTPEEMGILWEGLDDRGKLTSNYQDKLICQAQLRKVIAYAKAHQYLSPLHVSHGMSQNFIAISEEDWKQLRKDAGFDNEAS